MSDFGSFLRQEREHRGWSGERLAEELGTSQGNISMYEGGERVPRRSTIIKFSQIMGWDASSALLAAGYMPLSDAESGRSQTTPIQVLPSGRRFIALGKDGKPMPLSEQAKQRIDLELGFEEGGK